MAIKLPRRENLWQPGIPEVAAFSQMRKAPRGLFLAFVLNLKCSHLKIIFIPTLGSEWVATAVRQELLHLIQMRDDSSGLDQGDR